MGLSCKCSEAEHDWKVQGCPAEAGGDRTLPAPLGGAGLVKQRRPESCRDRGVGA